MPHAACRVRMLKIATKLQHEPPSAAASATAADKDLDFDLENGRELLSNVWRRRVNCRHNTGRHNSAAQRSRSRCRGIETRARKVLINFSQAKTGQEWIGEDRTDRTARDGRAWQENGNGTGREWALEGGRRGQCPKLSYVAKASRVALALALASRRCSICK